MITVVDSIMGSGKTTWCIDELLDGGDYSNNIMYITPYLDEIERVKQSTYRQLKTPVNKGEGKLSNIVELINLQKDIGSTHELFRRFDSRCKEALSINKYTLILDETITAVEPYHFSGKDDFKYLLENKDITVANDGRIDWIGSDYDTRFSDVRILAKNKCLFTVDDRFFLWHYPVEIFSLFENVYILTYMFEGSLMKYYFDLYHIKYEIKSIAKHHYRYKLVDYYKPDKSQYRKRLRIYNGRLNDNISQKNNTLSASWAKSKYNQNEMNRIKLNFRSFARDYCKASSSEIMWTCHKENKHKLQGKGYTNGFVSCNARATNEYKDSTCLMYGLNWFENPEITKFFSQHGIEIDQDLTALSMMLQWIWRSNIRIPTSSKMIDVYIPSRRMRTLFTRWLNDEIEECDVAA